MELTRTTTTSFMTRGTKRMDDARTRGSILSTL